MIDGVSIDADTIQHVSVFVYWGGEGGCRLIDCAQTRCENAQAIFEHHNAFAIGFCVMFTVQTGALYKCVSENITIVRAYFNSIRFI